MSKKIETRTFHFDLKTVDNSGSFEGYGSVWNVTDSYNDQVVRGAFNDTLADWKSKGRMPALLWQHDTREPIGAWKEMSEDSKGLHVRGELLVDAIPRALQAHALMKANALSGLSIGFDTKLAEFDSESKIRKLKAVNLWEISVVTFPALEVARVTGVKASDLATIRDFETFLRDVGGFSAAGAKKLAAGGWKALTEDDRRDGGADDNELMRKIVADAKALASVLKP